MCKFSENFDVIYWVKLCRNVNYDVIGGHRRSNGGRIGNLIIPPKTRQLGEGVCKFFENSVLIYGVKSCQNVNYDVI